MKQDKKNDKISLDNMLSSSFITPKLRIKYFNCPKGKDHEGEVLNYVCVKKDCEKRGLLCSMCKIDHPNHTTIPLKMLLSKLQTHKQKPLESSQGFQDELSLLEQIHKTMLYDLRVCVESLAEKFKELQVQINEQFSKAKIQLLQRVQINMKFNSFIEQAINNKCQNRESFIEDMSRIAGMIQVKERQQKQKQIEFKFSANFDMVVNSLRSLQFSITEDLKKIQKFTCDQTFSKYEDFKNSKNKKEKQEKQKEKQKQKQKKIETPKNFSTFSPDYKSASIALEGGQKIARQTKTGDGRFVFSNYHITSINQKITFKIKNLKNWIGLGVAIRDKIKYLNFRFEYNNLGHGSYLISSNGYSWSHSEQANNIVVVNFKFKQNDAIQVEYQKTKLIFMNKGTNQKFELKVAFNQAEEKDIYFCANLCSQGDCVQILQA